MAGRHYWIDLQPTAVTGAIDLLEITPADDKPIKIISLNLGQSSDFGDAQDEVISVFWVRGNTTSGSGGLSPTPKPCNASDVAAGFTCETFNTTIATAGTSGIGPRHSFNIRGGLERPYTPDEMFECTQASTLLCLRMSSAPADSLTIFGSVCVEEGG